VGKPHGKESKFALRFAHFFLANQRAKELIVVSDRGFPPLV
jgi:hypothetical protein